MNKNKETHHMSMYSGHHSVIVLIVRRAIVNFEVLVITAINVPLTATLLGQIRENDPKLWNSLPNHLRCIQELNSFNSALKTYLFKEAFKYYWPISVYIVIDLLCLNFVYLYVYCNVWCQAHWSVSSRSLCSISLKYYLLSHNAIACW